MLAAVFAFLLGVVVGYFGRALSTVEGGIPSVQPSITTPSTGPRLIQRKPERRKPKVQSDQKAYEVELRERGLAVRDYGQAD